MFIEKNTTIEMTIGRYKRWTNNTLQIKYWVEEITGNKEMAFLSAFWCEFASVGEIYLTDSFLLEIVEDE